MINSNANIIDHQTEQRESPTFCRSTFYSKNVNKFDSIKKEHLNMSFSNV